jgi:hypothetical protein
MAEMRPNLKKNAQDFLGAAIRVHLFPTYPSVGLNPSSSSKKFTKWQQYRPHPSQHCGFGMENSQ